MGYWEETSIGDVVFYVYPERYCEGGEVVHSLFGDFDFLKCVVVLEFKGFSL